MFSVKATIVLVSALSGLAAASCGEKRDSHYCLTIKYRDANCDLDKMEGDWYTMLHNGQAPYCSKVSIAHGCGTASYAEHARVGDDVEGTTYHTLMTFLVNDNIAYGPATHTANASVTNFFLASDDQYQSWSAFYQCIRYDNQDPTDHAFVVYTRQDARLEGDVKEEVQRQMKEAFQLESYEREIAKQKVDSMQSCNEMA